MSGPLVLSLAAPLKEPVDLSALTPDRLAPLPLPAVERLALGPNGGPRVGDLFRVRAGGPAVRLQGDFTLAHGIGADMADGELVVEGSAGRDVGRGMRGGRVDVQGDAGPNLGGPAPGERRGMTGGEIVVRGNAGAEAGARMRRGLVVIQGNASDHAGVGMIAGTVVIFGDAGTSPGLWSKRGSIVALGSIVPPPTYRFACRCRPAYLRLLLLHLRARYGLPVEPRHVDGEYRRWSGDLAELGKGEILAWNTV